MGCFLACFGSKKERRRRKQSAKRVLPKDQILQRNVSSERLKLSIHHENVSDVTLEHTICLNKDQGSTSDEPLEPTISLNTDCTETPIIASEESRDELVEENLSFNGRKKVTFDLNVQTYEEISTHEIKSDDDKEEKGVKEEGQLKSSSETSYPSNHRYQNCSNSDDDYEAESEEESDLDDYSDEEDEEEEDEDEQPQTMQDESSESFFSLPSAVQQRGSETPIAEKEVNSPLKTLHPNQNTRDRSQYVHSVLNPVENLTQWKAVKMRSKPPLKPQKENTDIENELPVPFSAEPTFRFSNDHTVTPKQEIAVDTSLSNWLGSSETTSTKTSNLSVGMNSPRSYSPRSHEDRPILGALTVEELRNFSATSSPRKSPSRSPDDMPIVGTVGSYWSHTGQGSDSSSGTFCKGIPNTTSKYREDKAVNWHTTPFEMRLERALNGVAEGYSG